MSPAPEPTTALPRPSLLNCVHCGLCLNACPTYRVLKHEPDSPRGRIYLMRAMEEGRLEPDDSVLRHLDLCLNCRACETACPAGVHYGDLLERTRARLVERGETSRAERLAATALRFLFHPRERLELAADLLRLAQRLGLMRLAAHPAVRRLLPAAAAAGSGLLPPVPSRAERALPAGVHAAYPPHTERPRARVGLLATCVVQPLYPRVNAALIHLLRVAGCEVVVPSGQTCCGSLHAHAGLRESARRQARANIGAFDETLDYVVVASAGCGATIKEYAALLEPPGASPAEGLRAAAFAAKARDALELLDELGLPPAARPVRERVAVHDPCHLAHGQGVRAAPRRLLSSLPGCTVAEIEASDRCCGSAGVYNLKHPEMAETLLSEKLATVRAVRPTMVSVANPGCLLHMEAGARRAGLLVPFVHPLEILARAYPTPPAADPLEVENGSAGTRA